MSIVIQAAKALIRLDVAIKHAIAAYNFKRSDALRIKNAKATTAAHERRTRALEAALRAHELDGQAIEAKDIAACKTCEKLDLQGSLNKAYAYGHLSTLELLV